MTVKVVLLNCGNHPSDSIVIKDGYQHANKVIGRGVSVEVDAGNPIAYDVIQHGSGNVKQYGPMAVQVEGPGNALVRNSFNPSGDHTVQRIKDLAAALINEISEVSPGIADEAKKRYVDLAIVAVEEAAMWGVKAATTEHEGSK